MKTKLTLSVEEEAVQVAKHYAELHDTTVSALFERFAKALIVHNQSKSLVADRYYGVLSDTPYAKMTEEELKAERHLSKHGY
jgi:Family of unknown function (DUF6364)